LRVHIPGMDEIHVEDYENQEAFIQSIHIEGE
jgi:hypothetical protein